MPEAISIVYFTEVNSKLGDPLFRSLAEHPDVNLVGLVTSPLGKLCTYFVDEPDPVDLERQAIQLDIPVFRPSDVNSAELVSALRKIAPDYFIVCNYQQIFRGDLLAVPSITSINFHPSPLPQYAGRAPFYWMVRHGEQWGTVSAIEMTLGIDAGPIVSQKPVLLDGTETTLQLRKMQEMLNVEMLDELIPQLFDKSFTRIPQDMSKRSYFGQPTDQDYTIDLSEPAESVRRKVRAANRYPGARLAGPDGGLLIVLRISAAGEASCDLPLGPAGTVRWKDGDMFVAAADEWLRVLAVERDGQEVDPRDGKVSAFVDGCVLAAPAHGLRADVPYQA